MSSLITSLGIERLSPADQLRLAREILARVPLGSPALAKFFGDGSNGRPADWSSPIDSLLALHGLKDDWDGQGAAAPLATLVSAALRFALDFERSGTPAPDRVIAGVNGTVFFEWHRPTGYLELEVVNAERAEGRIVWDGSGATESMELRLESWN